MNASMWAAAAVAILTPVVSGIAGWRFRHSLAEEFDFDREKVKQKSKALSGFSRDVGVNVLANLIEAAIIYLLAVLTGLLPSSPQTIVLAICITAMAMALILFPFGRRMSGVRGATLAGVVLILAGISALFVPFASSKMGWSAFILPLSGWGGIFMGIVIIRRRHQLGGS